jgi:hypothetical protein
MNSEKNTKKETTLDDLALMVAKGFNDMDEKIEKMDNRFTELRSELKSDIKSLKNDIKEIKADTENIKANLNKKVDKIEYNTLTYRVEKLEKKFA